MGGARLRHVFGKQEGDICIMIAIYLRMLRLLFRPNRLLHAGCAAFISTYRQTILLMQEYRHGGWTLSTSRYILQCPTDYACSAHRRQRIRAPMHLLAETAHVAGNNTAINQWRRRP